MTRMTREPARELDGLLLLDKPQGLSSNHALQRVRRLFRAKKAGHGGTLDPLATGMLLVCFGKATRVAGYLLDADKRYRAALKLGITTTTGDSEGEIMERKIVPKLSEGDVQACLSRFTGEIMQIPPMYSALKREGVPLYRLARKGIAVERKARSVRIHELRVINRTEDCLNIEVACSKGLYVRTLAEDVGAALGCGAHLSALRRTGLGQFTEQEMIGLADLDAMDEEERASRLLPSDCALMHLQAASLDSACAQAFRKGQRVYSSSAIDGQENGMLRCYGPEGSFLGIGRSELEGRIAPKAVFV